MFDDSLDMRGVSLTLFIVWVSAVVGAVIGWFAPFFPMMWIFGFIAFAGWMGSMFRLDRQVYPICFGVLFGMFSAAVVAQFFQLLHHSVAAN